MEKKGDFSDKMRSLKEAQADSVQKAGGQSGKLGLKKSGSGAAETAYIGEHKVASGETLSHIAVKYYNSGARDKWMAIYDANKDVIGDNPSMVRVGQVLKIPKLDD